MADIPNPPPDHSSLPSSIAQFAVSIDVKKSNALTHEQLEAVQEFRRAASYIAAAMIFLKDNILLERVC
jgi:xylulose-5-phosphate/fructose-6-phosphate phosphoketolase